MTEKSSENLPLGCGLISFSRASGSPTLYGTPFKPQHFIRISIDHARESRSLSGTNRLVDRENLYITVDMSASQFAEAITNMNVGSGVPCTVARLMGEEVPRIPDPVQDKDLYRADGEQLAQKSIEELDRTIALVEYQQTMPKKVKAEILDQLKISRKALADSLPFVLEQFDRHLETLVQTAKTDIVAYCDFSLRAAGLAANAQLAQLAPSSSDLPSLEQEQE